MDKRHYKDMIMEHLDNADYYEALPEVPNKTTHLVRGSLRIGDV